MLNPKTNASPGEVVTDVQSKCVRDAPPCLAHPACSRAFGAAGERFGDAGDRVRCRHTAPIHPSDRFVSGRQWSLRRACFGGSRFARNRGCAARRSHIRDAGVPGGTTAHRDSPPPRTPQQGRPGGAARSGTLRVRHAPAAIPRRPAGLLRRAALLPVTPAVTHPDSY
jgi:hypothetical protein